MSMIPQSTCQVQPGLDFLAVWLGYEGYANRVCHDILSYVAREGTVAGAPGLDACDEEGAEHAYCQGLEPPGGVGPAPDGPGDDTEVWLTSGDDLTVDRLSWGLERLLEAAPDLEDTQELEPLAPIAGGSPDDWKSLEAIRAWYAARPAFRQWVESQGGIAWEEGRD